MMMSKPIRYITDDTGQQIGVLLELDAYRQLSNPLLSDRKCLIGLSREELLVLANCKLSTPEQSRLDTLISRQSESPLSPTETIEVDTILAEADHLMVLKARAMYTLKRLDELAIAS
jgi:hypothetical protein